MARAQPSSRGSPLPPIQALPLDGPDVQALGNLVLSLPERSLIARRDAAPQHAHVSVFEPVTWPVHRAILAVDMENSTRQTNPVKEEMRRRIYHLLERALYTAGIHEDHLDRLTDRGDGVLALVRPVDEVPKTLLLERLMPTLSALLDTYNSCASAFDRSDRRLRLRAVIHSGEIHDDGRGFFGEALDVAFRLLDAAPVKKMLRRSSAPLVLVVSEEIFWSIVSQGYGGIDERAYAPLVRVQVAGRQRRGWVHVPEAASA